MAGVLARRRQSADGIHDLFARETSGGRERLPGEKLCQRGTTSDGSHTSLGAKLRLRDALLRDPELQRHDVATGRILDGRSGAGRGDVAGVARMLEVVEKPGRVHRRMTGLLS